MPDQLAIIALSDNLVIQRVFPMALKLGRPSWTFEAIARLEDALNIIEKTAPDVILIDFLTPGLESHERTCAAIYSKAKRGVIVAWPCSDSQSNSQAGTNQSVFFSGLRAALAPKAFIDHIEQVLFSARTP